MPALALPALKQGDTWVLNFVARQTAGGAPLDLTGCSAALQLRHPLTAALVAEPDSLVIAPLTGTVTVSFLPATTAMVPVGTYFTDLELIFATGEVRSSQSMTVPVIADYTRTGP
ncbi:MAG: hypothetical protein KAX51_04520 [Chromatiaceae bacterium]|nr:hypothetical protein [Chromatiaceae bacterium]MBP6807587.1 hypothetical protein [Chromatiaceae bacterium]MBP8289061.1 hypothetical protein [Chromatiaceae bacterium]